MQTVVVESGRAPSAATRAVLAGGVGLYLASIAVTNAGISPRAGSGWWWALAAAGVACADAFLRLPAAAVVAVLAALVTGVVIVGLAQEAGGRVVVEAL